MNEKKEAFFAFLDTKKEEARAEAVRLHADDRRDEEKLKLARMNIYDIMKALFGAAEKRGLQGDAFASSFLRQAEEVPSAWTKALAAAREHGDAFRAAMEEEKLCAAEESRAAFREIFGVEA